MKKRVVLLGATGSIGSQTLDILKKYPEQFELIALSAGSNQDRLLEIAGKFPAVKAIHLAHPKEEITEYDFYRGDEIEKMLKDLDYDLLINATVGFAGVKPTLTALEKGIDVALANKESLVVAGDLVKKAQEKSKARIIPIDSEHSAIYQCLQASPEAEKLYITASGGSLRDKKREELESVSKQQALAHPNWEMGARITLDSASMVNKAFEIIEAHYLFDMDYGKIEPLYHPQSLIHSMVQYEDGALLAQLGPSDMHEPIQFALFENRKPLNHRLDFSKMLSLELGPLDKDRFPMIGLVDLVAEKKGNTGAIINAADEKAIELFLQEKIGFLDIERSIVKALEEIEYIPDPDYDQLLKTDQATREFVEKFWIKETD